MPTEFAAVTITPGNAAGPVFRMGGPLSFWGGYDSHDGTIIEPSHPDAGVVLTGKIVLMARAKGSSSSSSVLAEAIRNHAAPAALVMLERDIIVALGAIVARELYRIEMPIVVVGAEVWEQLGANGTRLTISADENGAAILTIE